MDQAFSTNFVLYCPHGHSQLKHQKLRVGSYTEEVLEWFDYPRASTNPGYEVSCQGVPNRPAMAALLHRLCFVEASLTVEKAVYVLESGPTHSLVAKLPQHSSLVVREFCAAGEEYCEQGYGREDVKLRYDARCRGT